ncbi:amino acid permease [Bacillus sp. 179-C3.3 HS]|uniref:amino acid permease n=1 Tax=Bacillus sp. 179-C3.3 HS TaxID=3232162 RepID=UPI0039A16113
MKSRHLFMIALGGVIGTGLFLGSGLIIHQAGPGGAILSFIIGGLLMYLVMLCLGELAVAMPTAGSFQEYATKYIGPATGFMIGWLYWFSWACTIGLEFTSAGILLQRWFPDFPVWLWCLAFSIILFSINAISARSFAETEFWFSAIKVGAILLFIIIGIGAIFGIIHLKDGEPAPFFYHLTEHGGLFPNGLFAILFTMVTVNFSFQGTELVGIAAGESESPEKTLPRSIRNIIWRTMVFFVLSIAILSALLPWQTAGAIDSPFVVVLDKVGIPYAADIMNFIIITAVLSVANSGLYASSRMLWALSKDGKGPAFAKKLSKRKIPIHALLMTMAVSALSLLTSVVAPKTVYVWLISISGMVLVVVWMSICLSQFFFRRHFTKAGGDVKELVFRTPLYPFVPLAGFIAFGVILISLFFIEDQRIGLYCGIPLMIICYIIYFMKVKPKEVAKSLAHKEEKVTNT